MFGTLSIFMFVTLPNGRYKRASLASIPCEYSEREAVFRQFIDGNYQLLKASCGAEFVFRTTVDLP